MRAFDDRLLRCDRGRDFLVIDGAITRSGDAKPGTTAEAGTTRTS